MRKKKEFLLESFHKTFWIWSRTSDDSLCFFDQEKLKKVLNLELFLFNCNFEEDFLCIFKGFGCNFQTNLVWPQKKKWWIQQQQQTKNKN